MAKLTCKIVLFSVSFGLYSFVVMGSAVQAAVVNEDEIDTFIAKGTAMANVNIPFMKKEFDKYLTYTALKIEVGKEMDVLPQEKLMMEPWKSQNERLVSRYNELQAAGVAARVAIQWPKAQFLDFSEEKYWVLRKLERLKKGLYANHKAAQNLLDEKIRAIEEIDTQLRDATIATRILF